MIATAPNPLAPGFPRTWPDCQPAMAAIARHLIARGAEDEEVMICLMMDFPALPTAPGAAWRSDAFVANVTAHERFYLSTRPDVADNWRDEPSAYELQVVTSAADLVRLCRRCALTFTLWSDGADLQPSRKLLVGGPLYLAVRRYKADLVAFLEGDDADN